MFAVRFFHFWAETTRKKEKMKEFIGNPIHTVFISIIEWRYDIWVNVH